MKITNTYTSPAKSLDFATQAEQTIISAIKVIARNEAISLSKAKPNIWLGRLKEYASLKSKMH
ncbi:MAG: hypothetical protein B7Y83_06395 [Flavobacteriales bacterium 32-34-25]|nr:MAG: hypothetical protein B7Y83_06395 [Flavobacteriales bacterium 32-34-25]